MGLLCICVRGMAYRVTCWHVESRGKFGPGVSEKAVRAVGQNGEGIGESRERREGRESRQGREAVGRVSRDTSPPFRLPSKQAAYSSTQSVKAAKASDREKRLQHVQQ